MPNIERTFIKLSEEQGELAAALLEYLQSPNRSKSAQQPDFNKRELAVLEEACDTLLCCLDVIYKLGYDDYDINAEINLKVKKWKAKATLQ